MPASSVLNNAARVLRLVQAGTPADQALRDSLTQDRHFTAPVERRAISRAVFTYYRWWRWLEPEDSLQKQLAAALAAARPRRPGAQARRPVDLLRLHPTRAETTAVAAFFTAAHPELEPVPVKDVAGVVGPGPGSAPPATVMLWPHDLNATACSSPCGGDGRGAGLLRPALMHPPAKITGDTVRDDFNHIRTVIHYTKAAHDLGLWKSERQLVERYLPDRNARLLEAGCGAGRAAIGLWQLGYRDVTGFDFAAELVDQAVSLAQEREAAVTFLVADATRLEDCHLLDDKRFGGALFLFNGLMQIPGREHRRAAMRGLHRLCRPGAHFIFTSHDREDPADAKPWAKEAARWARGEQDPRLLEFGDRYFEHDDGRTFMHLPSKREVLEDITVTGWKFEHTATRDELASETPLVRNFSDNCSFWVARKT